MLTNEERREIVYSDDDNPTDPGSVGPDTPLEALNLNWREKDLPERQRTKHVHRLHPYLGKFIPQLVEIFLRKYFKPGQTVLDPFVGSGTTLVQANELGINAVGYDISAFNVLLCKVKTGRYDLSKADAEIRDVLNKVRLTTQSGNAQLSLWGTNTTIQPVVMTKNEYLQSWFAPQALEELLTYRWFVETGDYAYKDLLRIILSRSARSARLTTHFDLDFPKEPQREPYWCYKHSRECQPTTEAFKFLKRYSQDTIRRIKDFSARQTDAVVEIHHADSRKANIPPIHGVITSPPYVGLIDYHEQHTYAYHLLELEDRRGEEIGPAVRGSSKPAREQYQEDMVEVFENTVNSLVNGGRLIVVANDKSSLYDEIARRVGVKVEAVVQRHVNRRTGRRSTAFYESVFIWQKV